MQEYSFTSEESGNANLLNEGVPQEKIHFTGNVMVDSLRWAISKKTGRAVAADISPEAGWPPIKPFVLVTLHRPSNVDEPIMLSKVMATLQQIAERISVIFPVHPRTSAQLQAMGYPAPKSITAHLGEPGLVLLPPLGYDKFLALMAEATAVITDSGGIQEETTALGVPCLTVRENTERPVTLSVGTNTLVGQDIGRLAAEVDEILQGQAKKGSLPPLWDGQAAARIVSILAGFLGKGA